MLMDLNIQVFHYIRIELYSLLLYHQLQNQIDNGLNFQMLFQMFHNLNIRLFYVHDVYLHLDILLLHLKMPCCWVNVNIFLRNFVVKLKLLLVFFTFGVFSFFSFFSSFSESEDEPLFLSSFSESEPLFFLLILHHHHYLSLLLLDILH